MEFTFTPLRVVILVVLVIGYALWGGMTVPSGLPTSLFRMWLCTLLLFLLSATSATVVDHWVGNLDRTNIRWFYVTAGVAGMLGALVMLHVFRERVALL